MKEKKIWAIQYRPKMLDDFYCMKDLRDEIQGMFDNGNMTNLIFHGDSGVGKTTLAYIIGRHFLQDNFKQNFMELNASSERGIGTIQNKIKPFTETKPSQGIPFKICLFDEADGLTKDAKACLRSVMECKMTRFIFSCNDLSKLESGTDGKAIKSRCKEIHFLTVGLKHTKEKIGKIAKEEGISISEDAIVEVYNSCEGDLRRIENVFQQLSMINKDIKLEHVNKYQQIDEEVLKPIIQDIIDGHTISTMNKIYGFIRQEKIQPADLIHKICNVIYYNNVLSRDRRYQIIKDIIYAQEKLKGGANYLDFMQFLFMAISKGCDGK